jgi:iron(III) transport system ATP-binding protein
VSDLPPVARGTAMMFQSYALFPHLNCLDNVAFSLKMRGVGKAERHGRAREFLKLVHMSEFAMRLPAQLSGGQQQRVALARALIVEPETLLLDEPLSNLDANLREEMRFEIRRLHDQYRYTTVYVTHDQSEAMTTADLIAVMNAGKIDQLGTPEDIYDRPQSEFVARFIGASNVIKGVARDENHVAFAGANLQVVGAKLTSGQSATVAIRQHDIQLATKAPATPDNAIKATVTRQVFLGASRDYMVETPDGTTLRVVTATQAPVPKGTEVWLTLPPERCRALTR